jgi:protein phosphatase 2C
MPGRHRGARMGGYGDPSTAQTCREVVDRMAQRSRHAPPLGISQGHQALKTKFIGSTATLNSFPSVSLPLSGAKKLMSMAAQVCCDSSAAGVGGGGPEAEARARARAERRRRAVAAGPEAARKVARKHGAASAPGRRREMEDAVSVREAFAAGGDFYAVFDGHGCSHVAEACRDRMHELVAEEVVAGGPPACWTAAMERSFARMDAEASAAGAARTACRCDARKCDNVGSTAVVAVVEGRRVVVAGCGDSRAVLCRGEAGAVALTSDHKPDRPDEMERIEAAGGRVIFWEGARVLGVLAMSRAIGDGYLKPYVSSVPEVTVTDRTDADECLILASDGLWDVVSNEDACEVARVCLRRGRDRWCAEAAALLTKLALARRSSDNVSVVVVDLRPKKQLS